MKQMFRGVSLISDITDFFWFCVFLFKSRRIGLPLEQTFRMPNSQISLLTVGLAKTTYTLVRVGQAQLYSNIKNFHFKNTAKFLYADTDECSSPKLHQCEHVCHNTIGSYICSCRGNHVLMSDLISCQSKQEIQDDTGNMNV